VMLLVGTAKGLAAVYNAAASIFTSGPGNQSNHSLFSRKAVLRYTCLYRVEVKIRSAHPS
jgi:hypothetical protein